VGKRKDHDLVTNDQLRDRERKAIEYCDSYVVPSAGRRRNFGKTLSQLERGVDLGLQLRTEARLTRFVDESEVSSTCASSSTRPNMGPKLIECHRVGIPIRHLSGPTVDFRIPEARGIVIYVAIETADELEGKPRTLLGGKLQDLLQHVR
jgi:hypothetical protein